MFHPKPKGPLPLPVLPEAMVSHDALLDAVQAQPLPALTVTFPVDAAEDAVADSGVIENAHPGDWVILPAHCRHRVAWTDPVRETLWLAVHLPS